MKKVIAKFTKILLKGAVVAAATKAAAVVLKKVNKDGSLEKKANDAIDRNAEKLKDIAKTGVSKTLEKTNEAQEKLDATSSKTIKE
ncbi:MAG: hypothetical protein U0R17_02215 [Acidimicrobiia bacterium]